MNQRSLGSSALRISEIAFGCMSLAYEDKDTDKVIHQAIDYGINFFDTADLYEYGRNEELLAKALQGKRRDVIIATKVGNEWGPARDGWNWNPTKEYILKAIEGSLKRLNTDYIDLYQLHGGTIDDPIDETIEAFELLKEQGKIREYGISSIRPNVIRQYIKRSNIVSVMMQYNLIDRRPEEAMLDLLRDKNVSVIVRGALAKGLLVDKPADSYLGLQKEAISKIQTAINKIARANNQSNSQIATQFVLRQEAVATAAIGFRTKDQVRNLLEDLDKGERQPTAWLPLEKTKGVKLYANHR